MRVKKAKVSWCYYEDSFDHGSPWNAFRDPERPGPLFENCSSTESGKRLYLLWGRSHLQELYGHVSFLNRPRWHASYILGCEHACSHSLFSTFSSSFSPSHSSLFNLFSLWKIPNLCKSREKNAVSLHRHTQYEVPGSPAWAHSYFISPVPFPHAKH